MLGKVVHITSICSERLSGPKNSVTLLSKFMLKQGVTSEVYSVGAGEVFFYNGVSVSCFDLRCLEGCEFVIFSGVYHYKYPIVAEYAIRRGIPYCISPRSSLMVSSMKKSMLKKKAFLSIYGRRFLKKSAFIHFLSEDEKKNSLHVNARDLVCPNIVVDIPCAPLAGKEKVIGFLGRYDVHHKGLDKLMAALALSRGALIRQGYVVKLHGTDFKGGRKYLENLVKENDLQDLVNIGDALFEEEKANFLNKVSVFVHTSRYEGLPQAVMEAMAKGCAIAVTRGTNMYDAIEKGSCGILLDDDPKKISQELTEFTSSDFLVREKGINSHRYAKENYSGERVARCMLEKVQEALVLKN